jgi:hypothetical protein
MDCFVAAAPRNDGRDVGALHHRHCERSEAIHRSASADHAWIASSLPLLAMTPEMKLRPITVIASGAKQSIARHRWIMHGLLRRCFSQ